MITRTEPQMTLERDPGVHDVAAEVVFRDHYRMCHRGGGFSAAGTPREFVKDWLRGARPVGFFLKGDPVARIQPDPRHVPGDYPAPGTSWVAVPAAGDPKGEGMVEKTKEIEEGPHNPGAWPAVDVGG